MARDLISPRAMLAALAMVAAASTAWGQGSLQDPTRPASAGAHAQAGAGVSAGPALQSVLISRERKSAIISGERVELGGRYGTARLVRLTDSEALLQGPEGKTILQLVPDVEKKPAAAKGGVRKEVRIAGKATDR